MTLSAQPHVGPKLSLLLVLVVAVLLAHAALFWGAAAPLRLSLQTTPSGQPLQLRVVTEVSPLPAPRPSPRALVSKGPSAASSGSAAGGANVPSDPRDPIDPKDASPRAGASEPLQSPIVLGPATGGTSASPAQASVQTASAPLIEPASSDATASQPAALSSQALVWPRVPMGALPPSRLMRYDLSGMDKGLSYHASGELRWQHNAHAYDMALSVKAFLLGTRVWRSVGAVEANGLAPRRFSDQWRNERATHFDRDQQRVVFSSRSQVTPLEAGAQDQISLYVQLAAALASEPARFAPGTQLQVQTATISDALAWNLTSAGPEVLDLAGQAVPTLKWVCQPRSQRGTQLEVWLAQSQAWLPVRIRITQVSGSYIDLHWRSTEALPDLPETQNHTGAGTRP